MYRPQLESFLCDISLRVGTIIIAMLESSFFLYVSVVAIIQILELHVPGDDLDTTIKTLMANAVFCGSFALLSLFLLIGAFTESRKLIKPWLYFVLLYIVVYTIVTAISVLRIIEEDSSRAILLIIFGVANISMQYYFYLVVYSYYNQIGTYKNKSQ